MRRSFHAAARAMALTGCSDSTAGGAFGGQVAGVDVAASFACRPRNCNRGAKVSKHGLGNAIYISAFTLRSDRKVTVAAGWYGSTAERAVLREMHKKACGRFFNVLGPAAASYHRNTFISIITRKGAEMASAIQNCESYQWLAVYC